MIGRSCFTGAIIGLLFFPATASAHELHVFAHVHDTSIHGEAHYADESPIKNADVRAFDPAGKELARTKTDEQGKFTLQAQFRCDHRLVVDTGDGHGAEYTVAATELPEDLPPGADAPHPIAEVSDDHSLQAKIEAIDRQIVALRTQLYAYERQIRLRDLLGAIGYILGIAGVAFYVLGVKCKQSKSSQ